MSLLRMRKNMRHTMKWMLLGIAVIFALGIFFSFNLSNTQTFASTGAEVFARIAGKDILASEYQQAIDDFRQQQLGGQGIASNLRLQHFVSTLAWRQIYEEHAMALVAQERGIRVSKGQARQAMIDLANQQIERIAPDDTTQQKAQLRVQMMAFMNLESYRRRLLRHLLEDQLNQRAQPIEVRIAHILIKAGGPGDLRSDAAASELAQEVWRQARIPNADFARLAQQYSEDEVSKDLGGVVGWASADPPAPPDPDSDEKPDSQAAQDFVDEFEGAALGLKVNEISEPVKSQFGYHILKALEHRQFNPKETDPEKRTEAIESYRQKVSSTMMRGIRTALETKYPVEAVSPLLKGMLAEEEAGPASAVTEIGKRQRRRVLEFYLEAVNTGAAGAGLPLRFKIAEMYADLGEHEKALEQLGELENRAPSAQLWIAVGDQHKELDQNTEALQAYQKASAAAGGQISLRQELIDKFKAVGRQDLAVKERETLDRQQKQQQELQARSEALRLAQEQADRANDAANTTDEETAP